MPVISYGGLLVGSTQGSDPSIGAWIAERIRPQEIFPAARLQWPGFLSDGPILDQTAYPWDHVVIDRLYWPWGASRFAHAHVVVDDVTLQKIRLLAYANNKFQSLPFVMDDGWYSTPITTNLWMLPARPLSTAAPGGNALYLLTLVDDRYFWWETALQYDVSSGITAWTDLYTAIGAVIGVTITVDTVNAAYGVPTGNYAATYKQLPCVLDAVAWSCGQRVVRNLDGSVKTQNATTAIASQSTQTALYANRKRRGGSFDFDRNQSNDLSALVPATVSVDFQASGSGAPANGHWLDSVTLASLNLSQFPQPQIAGQPWNKVLHRYEVAQFGSGTTPANKGTLDTLTKQFATDWLLWQLASLDKWHVGILPWTPDGLDDIEWRVSGGEVFTHIRRGVLNPQEDLVVREPKTRDNCVGNVWVSEISYDNGKTWSIIRNSRMPCSSGIIPASGSGGTSGSFIGGPPLCQGTVGTLSVQVGTACIGGILYAQYQVITLVYDVNGCLTFAYGPVASFAIACCDPSCVPITSGSGPVSGSGGSGACLGIPCPACSDVTPLGYTFTVPAGFPGNTCFNGAVSGTPVGNWNVTQISGRPCYWYQRKGSGDDSASALLELVFDSDNNKYFWILSLFGSSGTWQIRYILALPPGVRPTCNVPITVTYVQSNCGWADPFNPPSLTLLPYTENCGSGGGGGVVNACCGTTPVATTLYARFTGVLSTLGCVPLVWNGSSWQSAVQTICFNTGAIALTCSGSGLWLMQAPFMNAPQTSQTSCSPFSLTINGTGVGALCTGFAFQAVVTTTPC